jgi:hypothetical protein
MEYFCYALALIALFYVLGLGFTILLMPESLRRYTLIFAPWVGYCYVNLPSWYVFYYGGQIGRQTARLILIPPIVCLVIELVRKRRAGLGRAILHFPTLGALAVASGGFVVISIPVFWPSGDLTTVSLGNNDIATYGAMARYLSEFSRHSMEGFVGQMAVSPLPLEWATKDFYFGPASFVAFAGKLLGLMPHQDLSLCAFLLTALGAAVTFILLNETLQLGVRAALIGVAFVAFHPMIQYVALEGFFPQVVGIGLALLIFWTNTRLLDKNNARFDNPKLWLLLTLLTCGLLLNYPHMLVFVWFFAAFYSISLAFLERSLHGIKRCAVANILAVLGTALILPQRIGPFIQIFKVYASVEAGWFIPWMAPDYLVGLMYKNPFLEVGSDWRVRLAVSIVVTLAFVVAMYIAHRNGFRRIVALGLACVSVYAGCFSLAVMGRQDGILGGYRSFKLVVFFLPLFGVILVALSAIVKSRNRRIDLAIKSVAAAAVIGGYAMTDKTMLRPARFARVEPEYETLRGLERTKSVKSINVLGDVYWPTLWTAYFLMHKKLYLAHQSYYQTSELIGEYDLEDTASLRAEIVHVKPIEPQVVTPLNKRFVLVGPVKRKVRAELGVGWFLGETGHVWSGKDGKRASVILHSQGDGVKVRLRLICYAMRGNDNLTVLFHGQPLGAVTDTQADGGKEIKISELALNKGDNEVDIISELDPIHPNATDPRLVSHSFTSVEIEEL